jgi:GNAT superfamily N-acetyltransferase
VREERDGYTLSDESAIDVDAVVRWLAEESYWARGRSREAIERSLRTSRVFSVQRAGELVALARVVSDEATFAWVCDVFVDAAHRGRGLGHWMVEAASDWASAHAERVILATRDAHSLYADLGFAPLAAPERWMERRAPHAGPVGAPLATLIESLAPRRRPGAVAVVAGEALGAEILASVVEEEGPSSVVAVEDATRLGLDVAFVAAWITLGVESELTAVGLTAVVARALAQRGIACNVLAGLRHDHLLVPLERADEALATLHGLTAS